MVEQHPASASLPLDFSGTVRWQLERDPERWVFAHALVNFSSEDDANGSPAAIACSISLIDVYNQGVTIAAATLQLALVDGIIPGRQYLFDYAHKLIRNLIRMSGEVRDDMIPLS